MEQKERQTIIQKNDVIGFILWVIYLISLDDMRSSGKLSF